MYGNKNTRQNDDIKTGNKYAERVEQFRYLGTTLTNQNSIHEDIKSSVKGDRGPKCVARVFACTIICRPYKLTLSDQAQITLQLTVFAI